MTNVKYHIYHVDTKTDHLTLEIEDLPQTMALAIASQLNMQYFSDIKDRTQRFFASRFSLSELTR